MPIDDLIVVYSLPTIFNLNQPASGSSDIENFFDNDVQYIRRSFPPSFSFEVTRVNGRTM